MYFNPIHFIQLTNWQHLITLSLAIQQNYMQNKIRILVIGAGPAGLSTLKALQQLQCQNKYEIVCFQKQNTEGGQWNYSSKSDVDEYGQHVHSSMYSQLWTNSPKECFQFHDYTLKQHFGKPVPSYLPRQMFKSYFMGRFEKHNLKQFIRFDHVVKNTNFDQKTLKFQVQYKNLRQDQLKQEYFDYVIVATGHFSYPNNPIIKGIQSFKGKTIHSHAIRQCKQFQGKNILILGGNISAQDLTIQCYKYGARSIIWAYKQLKIPYVQNNLPSTIELIQGLGRVQGNTVYFNNGQQREVDVMIFATGYLHSFPFLEDVLRLKTTNVLYPPNLYKGVVWDNNPRLFYVGMGNYIMCQSISQVQGFLVKDIISGKHRVPHTSLEDQTDMKRQSQMIRIKSIQECLKSQASYILQMIELTGYPKIDPHKTIPMFLKNNKNREQSILTYRDVGIFESIYTGQKSCRGKKPWLQMKQSQPTDPQGKRMIREFFQFDL